MSVKLQITKQRLLDSLQRLLDGKPERTRADNRISLSRINKEAGCSHGLIYKYPEVIAEAKIVIGQHKAKQQRNSMLDPLCTDKENRLKAERDKQEKLKRSYRDQRDNFQALADNAIKRENELLFRCYELQLELNRLNNGKVVSLHDKE